MSRDLAVITRSAALLAALLVSGWLVPHSEASPPEPSVNELCPVLPEEWSEPEFSLEYKGKIVTFCCKTCRTRFQRNPNAYLSRLPQFGGSEDPSPQGPSDPSGVSSPHAEAQHDHGEHQGARNGDKAPSLDRLWSFLGKLHPLAVHFPIALLLLGFLLEVGFLMTRHLLLHQSTRLVILAGGLSAPVSALLGVAAGSQSGHPASLATLLETHRILGVCLGFVGIVLVALSEAHHRHPTHRITLAYRASLVLATSLVGVTGHLGGMLVFGVDHLSW